MTGGAAADRYDKRLILIATQMVQIALAVLLGWLVMTNRIHIWHVHGGRSAPRSIDRV